MEDRKSILIIGDWFLDENWIVTKHNAFASSHPGSIHYLSKQKELASPMVGLCGVPAILGVLRSYLDSEYTIAAFGIWNRADTDKLKCIVCGSGKREKLSLLNPYTASGLKDVRNNECPYKECSCEFDSRLYNLATTADPNISTNRIIRVFEGHRGGTPQIRCRYDWIFPLPSDEQKHREIIDYEQLERFIKENNICSIIIEDHNRGLISDQIIDRMVEALKKSNKLYDTKWYIRSKTEHPSWLEKLNIKLADIGQKVNLRVIDYAVALEKKGPRIWRFGHILGRASLELLGEFSGDVVYEHQIEKRGKGIPIKKIAILDDDNTVIAKNMDTSYNIVEPLGPRQIINVGRTTMFFSCLVAQDIADSGPDFATLCRRAVHGAYAWSKGISEAWKKENFDFYNYDKVVESVRGAVLENTSVQGNNYLDSWTEWNQSSYKVGILNKPEKRKVLQLWRGEGAVKKYICVGGEKRNQINSLLASISAFNRQDNPSHPFNCLLVSKPGWGKSYLAKCLASECNMSYLEFSVSQMATTRDLIDSFDSICSHQNRTDKKVLIFMDEVNCEIEGNRAMGLLLSPIWDGSFIRDGKYYRLQPAVWVFASTEPMRDLIAPEKNKGSDFVSRLNGPIIELDAMSSSYEHVCLANVLENIKHQVIRGASIKDIHCSHDYNVLLSTVKAARAEYIMTEMVYVCLSLLIKFWGPISRIEEEVLWLFYKLIPINGIRSLEFFISKFQYVQRGEVFCKNVPLYCDYPELLRHVIYPPAWKNTMPSLIEYSDLIEIENMVEQ